MIGFQVTNNGLNGLAPLKLPSFLRRQPLGLTPVDDAHARILCVHAPIPQIHKHFIRLYCTVLHQNGGLLQL